MSTVNKLLGGRYQFIQVLGANEINQTLLVADVHYPGHPKCVIKQIPLPTRNPMTLKFLLGLLQKKVEVLEAIGRHDQIPSTFASFEANQNFYIVQEFILGRSLEKELVPGKPMPRERVLPMLRELLSILAFAQEHGVVHGCIKPSNVIRRREDGKLVLLDFGLAKDIHREVSAWEETPSAKQQARRVYLPLEQRQGAARFCSDHYALGMIAIQALTGLPVEELPDAEHPDIYQAITALLKENAQLQGTIATVLARIVHPDPERRYQHATDILKDLDRLISGAAEPDTRPQPPSDSPVAAPASTESPAQPMSPRRSRWRRWALAGLVLLALGGGSWGLRVPQRLLVSRHLSAAEAAAQANNPDAAIDHYSRVLTWQPNHLKALLSRARQYQETGQSEAAMADLTTAIAAHPENAEPAYARGNLRFTLGDIEGAIADYTRAIRQRPDYVKAYVNRGSARAEWGDDQGAVEDYTEAIALDPPIEQRAAAYLNRCLSYSNLGQQMAALEDCTEAISLRPSHSLAYQNRGLVRRRLGELQGSLQDYNIAIRLAPDSADPYYNRGLTRKALEDYTGALDDLSQAIALNPSHAFAYYDRGLLQAQLGKTAAAIADFEAAAQTCLDLGRISCYEDAQYQLRQLRAEPASTDSSTDSSSR